MVSYINKPIFILILLFKTIFILTNCNTNNNKLKMLNRNMFFNKSKKIKSRKQKKPIKKRYKRYNRIKPWQLILGLLTFMPITLTKAKTINVKGLVGFFEGKICPDGWEFFDADEDCDLLEGDETIFSACKNLTPCKRIEEIDVATKDDLEELRTFAYISLAIVSICFVISFFCCMYFCFK